MRVDIFALMAPVTEDLAVKQVLAFEVLLCHHWIPWPWKHRISIFMVALCNRADHYIFIL